MIQRVRVNLIPAYDLALPVIHLKQYDQTENSVGKQIELELYSGDDVYEIPSGATVTFQGTKLDKKGYQYEVTSFEGNLVTVDIKGQMTVLSGNHYAELRIVKDESILNSTKVVMAIDNAALTDDTVISETELPLIEKAIEASAEAIQEAKKIEGKAEQIDANTANIATKQDKLVSGTNIKTIGGESLLGGGDIAISTDYEDLTSKPSINGTTLTGNRVLVSKINDISPNSDGSITITTVSKDASDIATNTANIATNTANIAKKQETLVSGTNIKTVNGNSLLGSGNIDIDITSQLYYQSGDTIDYYYGGSALMAKTAYGYVTGSAKQCIVCISTKKRISSDLTCTLTSLQGIIRTTNGAYLDGINSTSYQWVGDTYTLQTNSTNGDDNQIVIAINKSEAFTNVVNNTPVVMAVRELKVTFS